VDGQWVSIEFPFAQAQSMVMTLPTLLSRALRRRMDDEAARFVFGLRRWTIENTDGERIIMKLATEDGFEVSFAIPFATCRATGWALSTLPTEVRRVRISASLIEKSDFTKRPLSLEAPAKLNPICAGPCG
jgi:hypothetical protein